MLTDFRVDIVPRQPNSLPAYPGCLPIDCDEVMYEVYIKTDLFYTEFRYSWLSILGRITVDGRELDGSSSFVEVERSIELCSPYYWNSAELTLQRNGIVEFGIGDPFPPPLSPNNSIPLTNGSALLFSVIVHAPLGSNVSWENTSNGVNPYVSCIGRNVLFVNCTGELSVSYGGGISPEIEVPFPTACLTPIEYNIDAPPYQLIPSSSSSIVTIPIDISGISAGTLIDEIEVLVEVRTSNYMEYGNVSSEVFDCFSYLDPDCEIKTINYQEGGFKFRKLHGIKSNFLYTGNLNLLDITLLGPINESIGDCAEVKVLYVRVKIAGSCCVIQPSVGNSVEVCYSGEPPCNEFSINVSELPSVQQSCDLRYKVSLMWTYPQPNLNFESLNFTIRFVSQVPFSQILTNSFCSSCISVTNVGPNLYDVTCSLSNSTLTRGSSFDLVFSGTDGCVKGYVFTESTLKLLAEPECVPELIPPYTLSSYSNCSPFLSGFVEYSFSQLCDDILIKATPSDGSSSCSHEISLINGEPVYAFCACNNKYPYEVKCSKVGNPDNGWLNGVTTYDLVLISKHILLIDAFSDVFQYYAADADCSGTLTTFDIVQIRKLILGIYSPGIPALDPINDPPIPNYKFFDNIPPAFPVTNGLCASEVTKTVPGPTKNANFYIVKTGDVNWASIGLPTFCLTQDIIEERSKNPLLLNVEYGSVNQGATFTVPVICENKSSFAAIQFELGFDPTKFRFLGINHGGVEEFNDECFGLNKAEDGQIRFGWYSETGSELVLPYGKVLFYLEFEALRSTDRGSLRIGSDLVDFHSVAFDFDGHEREIKDAALSKKNELITTQLNPNPFRLSTELLIQMPREDNLRLDIFNAVGELINSRSFILFKGQNELMLQSSDFQNTEGVYLLILSTSTQTISLLLVKQ